MRFNIPDSEELRKAFAHFRCFLNDAWPSVNRILMGHDWDNDPYLLEDWLDDNWKHLFVRQVLGEGADLQPLSISIDNIERGRHQYQLQIIVPFRAIFVALGTNNNGFSIAPPFEQVQVLNACGEIEVVSLSSVTFILTEEGSSLIPKT